MKKNYLFRIIFWSIIFIILLFCGIVGIINSNKNFNNNKDKINKIITIFNNHSTIKEFSNISTNIEASLNNKKIIINYNDINSYKFTINNNYLETTINKNDSNAKIALMLLADSIAVYYGREEKTTFTYFTSDKVLSLELNDGISYKENNNKYIVKLNLNKYIKSDN